MLTAACKPAVDAEPAPAAAPIVSYIEIRREPLTEYIKADGRIRPDASAEVRPRVDGIVLERRFEEGARVHKGDVLYVLESEQYQLALKQAQAAEARAAASADEAKRILARRRALFDQKAVSLEALETAQFDLEVREAERRSAAVEREQAALNLSRTLIRSPIDGIAGESAVTQGALVTAHQSEALTTVRADRSVYADMSLPVKELQRLRRMLASGTARGRLEGAPVNLFLEDGTRLSRLSDPNEPIDGTLVFVDAAVNETTSSVNLRARIDNPDGILLEGMKVKTELPALVHPDAVLVPQKALFLDPRDGHSVFVLVPKDSRFEVERRPVVLGGAFGQRRLVLKGLEPSERVLVEGLSKVHEGDLVEAQLEAPSEKDVRLSGGAS